MTEATAAGGVALEGRPPRSLWLDALRQLGRNRGAVAGGVVFLALVLVALLAPLLAPFDPVKLAAADSLLEPGAGHLLGTDPFGRDVLSRVLYGSRTSLSMGLVAVTISVTAGALLGLLAGYYRGWVDSAIMRLADVMLAFPGILLALVIIAVLGPNLSSAMIAVGVSATPVYIRVVRGSVLGVREREFVEAARTIGCPDARILAAHIFPNVLAPIIVLATLGIPNAIIAGAALSFLGLGVKPPTPDWGAMLAEGKNFIGAAWWLSTFPGLAIALAVLAINLLGDGLRDALDPRMKV